MAKILGISHDKHICGLCLKPKRKTIIIKFDDNEPVYRCIDCAPVSLFGSITPESKRLAKELFHFLDLQMQIIGDILKYTKDGIPAEQIQALIEFKYHQKITLKDGKVNLFA